MILKATTILLKLMITLVMIILENDHNNNKLKNMQITNYSNTGIEYNTQIIYRPTLSP